MYLNRKTKTDRAAIRNIGCVSIPGKKPTNGKNKGSNKESYIFFEDNFIIRCPVKRKKDALLITSLDRKYPDT